jgi:putrescine aminotransferase
VICGFGRTGRWFGCETMGFRPDLMTFAKGVTSGYVPLGGVMVGDRVAKVLIEQGGEFNHGYTYSGHPVACAVALANIQLIQQQGLVEPCARRRGPVSCCGLCAAARAPAGGRRRDLRPDGSLLLVKDKARGTPFDAAAGIGMVCRGHCFRERADHARRGRPHDHRAAAGHHAGPDRRDGGADPPLPRPDAGRRAPGLAGPS